MNNLTRETFLSLFEDELQLLRNKYCSRCDPDIKHPLLPWLVGRRFAEAPERVVFVGKPHRGIPGRVLPSGVIDPTDELEGLWNSGWAYWSYTREIAERLYGSAAADWICFTNVIKCTNTHAVDSTTESMADNCISGLNAIWAEVRALQARTLVFYTYKLFPQKLEEIPFALPRSVRQVTPPNHKVPCGQKQLGWWERTCATPWAGRLRILVVGHPERMKRSDYVGRLVVWIRPNEALQPTAPERHGG